MPAATPTHLSKSWQEICEQSGFAETCGCPESGALWEHYGDTRIFSACLHVSFRAFKQTRKIVELTLTFVLSYAPRSTEARNLEEPRRRLGTIV